MSRVVSRHQDNGTAYTQAISHHGQRKIKQSGQRGTNGTPLTCNRCRQPLSTTVFVCKCDCVFCEDCTYSHFSDSSSCPACGMTLGAEDFQELCIADPSSEENHAKRALQQVLTKSRSGSTHIGLQDLCMHGLKSIDQCRRTNKFILKQVVMHEANHAQSAGKASRAYEKLQAEHAQVQQARTSERLEYEQITQELRNQNSALASKNKELEQKSMSKDQQIAQFREHFRQTPGSSHSHGSSSSANNGKRHRIDPPLMQSRQHHPSSDMNRNSSPPPPMQAFVKNKAMAAVATRNAANKRPILSQRVDTYPTDSVHNFTATPIHVPNTVGRPSSGGSSSGSRVRDIRSSSSYTFGGNNQRSGGGHSPAMVFAKPHRGQSFQGFR